MSTIAVPSQLLGHNCSLSLLFLFSFFPLFFRFFFGWMSFLFCFLLVHATPVLSCTLPISSLCILINVHLNISGLRIGLSIRSAQISGPVVRHALFIAGVMDVMSESAMP